MEIQTKIPPLTWSSNRKREVKRLERQIRQTAVAEAGFMSHVQMLQPDWLPGAWFFSLSVTDV